MKNIAVVVFLFIMVFLCDGDYDRDQTQLKDTPAKEELNELWEPILYKIKFHLEKLFQSRLIEEERTATVYLDMTLESGEATNWFYINGVNFSIYSCSMTCALSRDHHKKPRDSLCSYCAPNSYNETYQAHQIFYKQYVYHTDECLGEIYYNIQFRNFGYSMDNEMEIDAVYTTGNIYDGRKYFLSYDRPVRKARWHIIYNIQPDKKFISSLDGLLSTDGMQYTVDMKESKIAPHEIKFIMLDSNKFTSHTWTSDVIGTKLNLHMRKETMDGRNMRKIARMIIKLIEDLTKMFGTEFSVIDVVILRDIQVPFTKRKLVIIDENMLEDKNLVTLRRHIAETFTSTMINYRSTRDQFLMRSLATWISVQNMDDLERMEHFLDVFEDIINNNIIEKRIIKRTRRELYTDEDDPYNSVEGNQIFDTKAVLLLEMLYRVYGNMTMIKKIPTIDMKNFDARFLLNMTTDQTEYAHIGKLMHMYIHQDGIPTINVEIKDGTLSASIPDRERCGQNDWTIPLFYIEQNKEKYVWMQNCDFSLTVDSSVKLLDPDGFGFYYVNYTDTDYLNRTFGVTSRNCDTFRRTCLGHMNKQFCEVDGFDYKCWRKNTEQRYKDRSYADLAENKRLSGERIRMKKLTKAREIKNQEYKKVFSWLEYFSNLLWF